jgi:hypothetical protein
MITGKDSSIRELLDLLAPERRGWTVVDHWEADLCAIGFASSSVPRRLVYVSTYDKVRGRYDYECEAAAGAAPEDYVTTETGKDVELSSLIVVLERHLDAIRE